MEKSIGQQNLLTGPMINGTTLYCWKQKQRLDTMFNIIFFSFFNYKCLERNVFMFYLLSSSQHHIINFRKKIMEWFIDNKVKSIFLLKRIYATNHFY